MSLYPEATSTQLILSRIMGLNYKNNVQRDSQVKKAYTWQREFYAGEDYGEQLSKTEAELLIGRIFSEHGLPTPKVVHRMANSCSWVVGGYSKPEIRLAPWGLNTLTILHEAAHGINCYADYTRAGHGAEWMRIFIDLIMKYNGDNGVVVLASAINAGLKVASSETKPTIDQVGNVADAWTFDVDEALQSVADSWTF